MSELSDSEFLFTSESVTEGHPDKIADQISDGVLDAVMAADPHGRVACETLVNTGLVVVSGEISTNCYVDVEISPLTTIRPVFTSVSHATRPYGSSRSTASSTPSEIWSAILSGCPSVTDSDVNRNSLSESWLMVAVSR